MTEFFALLTLAPVLKGLVAMVVAGATFPLCGVLVLRLDLIPLRYMLMHGVILGGALSLALSLPLLPVTVLINVVLVFVLLAVTKDTAQGFGLGSAAAMVFSMALASLVIHKFHISANDTLGLLWGSPYALQITDLVALGAIAVGIVLYVTLNSRSILAIFFNQEVAHSLGIRVQVHYTVMVLLVALTVAVSMKIVGALLIDALLILPVLVATRANALARGESGMKRLFLSSALVGLGLSTVGFFVAVAFDLPPSGAVAVVAAALYFVLGMLKKESKA